MSRALGALGAEVEVTPVGNVIAHVGRHWSAIALQGHADEISFVVRSIDAQGFVWLSDGQAGSRRFRDRYPSVSRR